MFMGKVQNYLNHGPQNLQNATIKGNLHSSNTFLSNLDEEIFLNKEKSISADYPFRVINELQSAKGHGNESFIIPTDFHGITKPFKYIEIPFCKLNEIKSKQFLRKFQRFINDGFRVKITWKTKIIQSFFLLKGKSNYKSCFIYKGNCWCGSRYIRETKQNVEVRWNEHNDSATGSEPFNHLRNNIDHCLHVLHEIFFQMLQKMLETGRT